MHPPVSNTERQRRFRQRNPGYYARIKAKQRARGKAILAEYRALEAFKQRFLAELTKPVLMLPAPVVDPLTVELNALRAKLQSPAVPEPLPARAEAA